MPDSRIHPLVAARDCNYKQPVHPRSSTAIARVHTGMGGGGAIFFPSEKESIKEPTDNNYWCLLIVCAIRRYFASSAKQLRPIKWQTKWFSPAQSTGNDGTLLSSEKKIALIYISVDWNQYVYHSLHFLIFLNLDSKISKKRAKCLYWMNSVKQFIRIDNAVHPFSFRSLSPLNFLRAQNLPRRIFQTLSCLKMKRRS